MLSDSILDLPSRCKGSSLPDVHNTTQEARLRQKQNTRAKQSFKPGGSAKFVRPVFSLFCFIWNMVWSSLDSSLTCLNWPCNCQPHACKHHRVLLHGQRSSSFTLFPAFDPASCAFWQFVFFFLMIPFSFFLAGIDRQTIHDQLHGVGIWSRLPQGLKLPRPNARSPPLEAAQAWTTSIVETKTAETRKGVGRETDTMSEIERCVVTIMGVIDTFWEGALTDIPALFWVH